MYFFIYPFIVFCCRGVRAGTSTSMRSTSARTSLATWAFSPSSSHQTSPASLEAATRYYTVLRERSPPRLPIKHLLLLQRQLQGIAQCYGSVLPLVFPSNISCFSRGSYVQGLHIYCGSEIFLLGPVPQQKPIRIRILMKKGPNWIEIGCTLYSCIFRLKSENWSLMSDCFTWRLWIPYYIVWKYFITNFFLYFGHKNLRSYTGFSSKRFGSHSAPWYFSMPLKGQCHEKREIKF